MIPDYLKKIDVYLFDQIQRGKIQKGMKILDAGCGTGRNMLFFIEQGFDISGLDVNEKDIVELRKNIEVDFMNYDVKKVMVSSIERNCFESESFDFIICSAVLHFAENEVHFFKMLGHLVRMLKHNGTLFIRMTGLFTIEHLAKPLGEGRYYLPDGSVRFLLTKNLLKSIQSKWDISVKEGLKTIHVHGLRSMTNLVLFKK